MEKNKLGGDIYFVNFPYLIFLNLLPKIPLQTPDTKFKLLKYIYKPNKPIL